MAQQTKSKSGRSPRSNPIAEWWSGVDRSSKVLYGAVVVVCLGFYILLGNTLYNVGTLQSMGFQIGEFMFLALAMGIVMLTGGIDLSVVANMNVSAIIIAWMLSGSEMGRLGSPRVSIAGHRRNGGLRHGERSSCLVSRRQSDCGDVGYSAVVYGNSFCGNQRFINWCWRAGLRDAGHFYGRRRTGGVPPRIGVLSRCWLDNQPHEIRS